MKHDKNKVLKNHKTNNMQILKRERYLQNQAVSLLKKHTHTQETNCSTGTTKRVNERNVRTSVEMGSEMAAT